VGKLNPQSLPYSLPNSPNPSFISQMLEREVEPRISPSLP